MAGQANKKADTDTSPAGTDITDAVDFEIIELLFFAYRDFTSDPDVILEKRGFGRAHHRVLHFVDREPGMTVADLLDTLRITKQSLARVLKQLITKLPDRRIAGSVSSIQQRKARLWQGPWLSHSRGA